MRPTRTLPHRALTAAATASLLSALTLSLVACGGGGEESGRDHGGGHGRTHGDGRDDGHGPGGDDGRDGQAARPLSAAELRTALLRTGDVPGYRAQADPEDPLPAENTIEPNRPACEPVTDTVDSRPSHRRTAHTGGVVTKGGLGTGGTVQQVLLAAYREGEAAAWLEELATAVRRCRAFTGEVGTGERAELRITPGKRPAAGDDAVRFTMADARGKDAPTVFTVVRSGANTATFLSIGVSGTPKPVAEAVVAAQVAKLAAAARK